MMKSKSSCLLSDNKGNSLIGDDDLPGKNIVLSIRTVYLQDVKQDCIVVRNTDVWCSKWPKKFTGCNVVQG